MERDAFLDHLRLRLTSATPTPSAHPIADGDGLPDVGWPEDERPLPEQFVAAVEAHGGTARLLRTPEDLEGFVGELIDRHEVTTAVATGEPILAQATDLLAQRGVDMHEFDSPATADVDLGVTGAVAGIARTGTVVLDTSKGRSVSLLPEVHLVLLAADDLVPTPSDVWRDLPRRFAGTMPSQVVLVTGPSKSADVEGVLTVGVHGPRAVWVGLLTS
ncbi:MAG: lactate utilization protein [Nitriliruptorales bacterium]|nr:lactate utilization protein [Nitriliruptorales bacterium]